MSRPVQHDAHADAWLDALDLTKPSDYRAEPQRDADIVNVLSIPQRKALRMFARTGGDLDTFAEDIVGCRGAAMWRVFDALVRKGYVDAPTDAAGHVVTDAGWALMGGRPIPRALAA